MVVNEDFEADEWFDDNVKIKIKKIKRISQNNFRAKLRDRNLSEVARISGIPYQRLKSFKNGKTPKIDIVEGLEKYFEEHG